MRFASPRRLSRIAWCTVLVLSLAHCETERFALRPTVAEEHDDVPFHHRPAVRPHDRISDAVDIIGMRSATTALSLDFGGPARNVNALEEVPDSTWFTNRVVSPEQAAVASCENVARPVPPFVVTERKGEGTTPGLFVHDAAGHRWLLKVDVHVEDRPETSTAADAIGARIYWALGYNTPCNYVVNVQRADLSLDPRAYVHNDIGERVPFPEHELDRILSLGVHDEAGNIRLGASSLLSGDIIGPWSGTGVRRDDPNDMVPHEDRRELRGERYLAAWLNHWDAREVNTLDAFEPVGPGGDGFVRHYFVDWSDALGGRTVQRNRAQSMGWQTMVSVSIGDQPWRAAHIDPSAPNLGYFSAHPFDPLRWQPILPVPRFDRADDDDLAWAARRAAAITHEHIARIAPEGAFSNPHVTARVIDILDGRRDILLRTAFARRSPLADFTVTGEKLCAIDLAMRTHVVEHHTPHFRASAHVGLERADNRHALPIEAFPHGAPDRVCVNLPPAHIEEGSEGDPHRYVVIEIERADGPHTTVLRAHLYDLGAREGYRLAGLERLAPAEVPAR